MTKKSLQLLLTHSHSRPLAKTKLDFGINIDLATNATYLQSQVRIMREENGEKFFLKKQKTQLYE